MIGSRTHEAHVAIRGWLRDGSRRPGEAVVVKDTAAALRLSVTPVREALERLVGEGLIAEAPDRAGFIMPRYTPRDYNELLNLHAILVEGALTRAVIVPEVMASIAGEPDSRTAAEILFCSVMTSGGGRTLGEVGQSLSDRLAPFRLVELAVLGADADEIVEISRAIVAGKGRSAVRAYHRRRAHRAVDIVQARHDMSRPDYLAHKGGK